MNILQIVPRIPFPLTDGGAIGIFNITKHLALRGHAITMVCFASAGQEVPAELARWCRVHLVTGDTGHGVMKVFRSYRSGIPYTIEKFRSDAMMKAVLQLCSENSFDCVHADHLVMGQYAIAVKERFGIPILLREHNYETTMLERFAATESNLFLKAFAWSEYRRMMRYEPAACRRFDSCAMITEADERRIKKTTCDSRTVVIPAGIDIGGVCEDRHEDPKTILFLASLDWKPNIDGFFWFYHRVLDQVAASVPDVRVMIVGKGKSTALQTLDDPRISFLGFVPDVAPYIERASVCIVPLFTGSGMRIKILEMMGHAKAIISTSIGCEGILVKDNESMLIADDPLRFAGSVVSALEDPSLRRRLGANALSVARSEYSWESVAEKFESEYQCICAQ